MGEPKKRKRPRRGFVACPACGAEARMGLKTCPECNAKMPGAGGFPVWIVVVLVLAVAAAAAGYFLMQKKEPKKRKARRPRRELIETGEETTKPAEKKEKAEEGDILDDLFGDAGLPEPTMVAPGTEKVKPEEEGEIKE